MTEERTRLEKGGEPMEWDALDPVLRQSLSHFKASVHAWSASVENQPRAIRPVRHRVWRLAVGWALAAVLVAGGVSGWLVERHHQQVLAQQAHERYVEQQRELAEQKARTEEDLLAKVESDISREVPSAMEPLAQLMTNDSTQTGNVTQ